MTTEEAIEAAKAKEGMEEAIDYKDKFSHRLMGSNNNDEGSDSISGGGSNDKSGGGSGEAVGR